MPAKRLWSVHPKPKDDELLSSWLVRIARGHGVKLHSFCRAVFGARKQIWNRDIDKHGDVEIQQILANFTATPTERVAQCVLRYEGLLYEHHNANGNTSLLNALGIYHRLHLGFGLQFCPECLGDDTYYRKRWRISAVVYCNVHKRLLHDRCPRCARAVNFHRGELGHKSRSWALPMYRCYACQYDLRMAPKIAISRSLQHSLEALTERHADYVANGVAVLPSGDRVYSHLYFTVLRNVMAYFGGRAHFRNLSRAAALALGFDHRLFRRRRLLEHESTKVRAAAVASAEWFLEGWPDKTIQRCHQYNVWGCYLVVNLDPCPYWFWREVRSRLHHVHAPWRKTWKVGRKTIRSYAAFVRAKVRQRCQLIN